MRCHALAMGEPDGFSHIRCSKDRNRRQSHQRAVPRVVLVVGPAPDRGPEPDKAIKGLPRGDPDVKAAAVDAVLTLLHHRTNLFSRSISSSVLLAISESARQSAMLVSSVHSPGLSPNG